jgi:bifunctional DNase/RNase
VHIPRPQTHDLLANVVRALGATLKEIRITHVESGTFFAQLVLMQDGQEVVVDSRPSDAIALGVADNASILVEDEVLTLADQDARAAGDPAPEIEPDDDDEDQS